ncbi:MAG: hypothetical protein ABIT71_10635 [Vicinamibacteraceae bacterium]
MKSTRHWRQMVGVAVVVVGGTAASAQSPDSTTSREVISATGCVSRMGADGNAAAVSDGIGAGFVLKGVRIAPSVGLLEVPRTPPTGTPGSNEGTQATNTAEPGSGASAAEAKVSGAEIVPRRDTGLLLVADRGVELAEHIGHRVMVTGRLSSFAAPDGVASAASGRTLTVSKVSMIAPACTTGS